MILHGGPPFTISTSSPADYFFSESMADGIHEFFTTKGQYYIAVALTIFLVDIIILITYPSNLACMINILVALLL